MTIWRNPALWVVVSAVALFWLSDYALGTPLNRDVIDVAGIFFGLVMAIRLLPDAADRFLRGGGQKNWQLLLSNELFWIGWVAFCTWGLIYRAVERPEWMTYSPMNGFFKLVILGAGVVSFFATTETPTPMPATKIYYVAVGLAAGGLLGFVVAKLI